MPSKSNWYLLYDALYCRKPLGAFGSVQHSDSAKTSLPQNQSTLWYYSLNEFVSVPLILSRFPLQFCSQVYAQIDLDCCHLLLICPSLHGFEVFRLRILLLVCESIHVFSLWLVIWCFWFRLDIIAGEGRLALLPKGSGGLGRLFWSRLLGVLMHGALSLPWNIWKSLIERYFEILNIVIKV